MADPFAEGPVHEQGEGAPFVIRLSRNASGARSYTVGATLKRNEVPEAVVDALFEIERLVAERMTEPKARKERELPLTAQLRRSLIVERLKGLKDTQGGMWLTTPEIVLAVNGHRSQVHADLQALVKEGVVEYQRGKGGLYPSTYRLASAPKARAQKGAKA